MAVNKNANVTIIPTQQRVGSRKKTRSGRRCVLPPTAVFSQTATNKLPAMREHYTAYINPEWELAGIFADDGLSGIDTRKRR